jgi:hypothetical protein
MLPIHQRSRVTEGGPAGSRSKVEAHARGRCWLPLVSYVSCVACAFWLSGAGCGPDKKAQKQARDMALFLEQAKQDPELVDPLGQAVVELAQTEAPGWVKQGTLFRGSLAERARQSFLVVLTYGHCYRFLGVGGGEVRDMDLLLFDANGVEVQRDVTQSATPVLGASASICPADPSAMRIETRMRVGSGPFAIALLHDPD